VALTLKLYQRIEVQDSSGNVLASQGSRSTSVDLTASGELLFNKRFYVATASLQKLFDVATDLADFDCMWIVSDKAIELELVAANGASQVMSTVSLAANVPFVISDDASRQSDHTEDWAVPGTADTIDKITAYNTSGANATILVIAAT
jgi:hypothetical protein